MTRARPRGVPRVADDVVVTGLGLVTALGSDRETVWRRLLAGEDGTGPVTRFPTDQYRARRACEIVPDPSWEGGAASLLLRAALRSAREAVRQSGIEITSCPSRVGLIFGTLGSADLSTYEESVRNGASRELNQERAAALMPATAAAVLGRALGCRGRVSTVLTACSSGNHALAMSERWIRSGRADAMIVSAADVLSQTQFTHFHNLRVLSRDVCRPFDRRRRGLVLGEGAACIVLERESHARARGADVMARLLGSGLTADAFHMTAPASDGRAARHAITAALRGARLAPEAVDYISAHGSGTPLNDRIESGIISRLFGRRAPASSVKGGLGHCMGAASAIEAAVCVLAIRDQIVPPTAHCEEPDPECPIDCVSDAAREFPVRVALNLSFAFGGNNAAVAFGAHA